MKGNQISDLGPVCCEKERLRNRKKEWEEGGVALAITSILYVYHYVNM